MMTIVFYSMNLLMIAKSYQKLKDKENAIKYLKMTREYPVKTLDDQQVRFYDYLISIGINMFRCGWRFLTSHDWNNDFTSRQVIKLASSHDWRNKIGVTTIETDNLMTPEAAFDSRNMRLHKPWVWSYFVNKPKHPMTKWFSIACSFLIRKLEYFKKKNLWKYLP